MIEPQKLNTLGNMLSKNNEIGITFYKEISGQVAAVTIVSEKTQALT